MNSSHESLFAGVNKVVLVGNVATPVKKFLMSDGSEYVEFILRTERQIKNLYTVNKQIENHKLRIYGRLGLIAYEYLKPGRQIYAEGRLTYDSCSVSGMRQKIADLIEVDQFQMISEYFPNSGKANGDATASEKAAKATGVQGTTAKNNRNGSSDIVKALAQQAILDVTFNEGVPTFIIIINYTNKDTSLHLNNRQAVADFISVIEERILAEFPSDPNKYLGLPTELLGDRSHEFRQARRVVGSTHGFGLFQWRLDGSSEIQIGLMSEKI